MKTSLLKKLRRLARKQVRCEYLAGYYRIAWYRFNYPTIRYNETYDAFLMGEYTITESKKMIDLLPKARRCAVYTMFLHIKEAHEEREKNKLIKKL